MSDWQLAALPASHAIARHPEHPAQVGLAQVQRLAPFAQLPGSHGHLFEGPLYATYQSPSDQDEPVSMERERQGSRSARAAGALKDSPASVALTKSRIKIVSHTLSV